MADSDFDNSQVLVLSWEDRWDSSKWPLPAGCVGDHHQDHIVNLDVFLLLLPLGPTIQSWKPLAAIGAKNVALVLAPVSTASWD